MPHADPTKRAEYQAAYRLKNKDKRRLDSSTWRELYPDKDKESKSRYYKNNQDSCIQRSREYRAKNLEVVNARDAARRREKTKTDPHFRIATNLRSRLRKAICRDSKQGSAVTDLGCSIADFKDYISTKFTEDMSWENYGEWHLDHIRPLASFDLTKREDFLQAVNFTNYQPLWALDNIKKGSRYEYQSP